jgi:hypothetical protein
MTRREPVWALVFSPILLGLLLLAGPLIVWKLPTLCCQRMRAVRYLPLVGLVYYGIAVTLLTVSFGLPWWAVLALVGLGALEGLLPDPVSFIVSPAKRRAVIRAIEFVEQQGGPRAHYGMVAVVGSEPGRYVVSVAINSGSIPPARRFLAVGTDGSIEELDFEYVAVTHGVHPWL